MKITAVLDERSLRQLEQNLTHVVVRLERGAKREAVRKAGRPIVAAAKRRVPRRFGHLKKAISSKVRTYKAGKMVVMVIGARRDYRVKHPNGRGNIRPANYSHLVEFGTSTASAQPFLRPAFKEGEQEAIAIYGREVGNSIRKAAARFNARRRI